MSAGCGLPWCVEHDTDPGVLVHWSRPLGDPVPLTLSRYDDPVTGPGRVQILAGDAWLTPQQARELAFALVEVAGVAERA